jgi:hypothetical protein
MWNDKKGRGHPQWAIGMVMKKLTERIGDSAKSRARERRAVVYFS